MADGSPHQTLSSSATTQAVISNGVDEAMTLLQTKQPPFSILELPLELRETIYRYALISSPLRTHRYHSWLKITFKPNTPRHRAQPSLNLLLTNHQIYSEASRVLYHEGCFTIPPYKIGFFEGQIYHFDTSALDDKWYHHIRNIEMEIGWYGLYFPIENDCFEVLVNMARLLAAFPHLKAITVAWQSYSSPVGGVDVPGTLWAVDNHFYERPYLVKLMEPLRSFQLSHPAVKITVQAPAESLFFTKLIMMQGAEMGLAEFMARNEK